MTVTNRMGWMAAFGAAALGLGAQPSFAAPKVLVEPMEIDLGTIDEGNSFERYIEVKNVGDEILVLEEVKTSCGCTAAAVDGTTELKAGQSQKVKVTFNSKGQHEGALSKNVTVITNDPENKSVNVALKGTIHTPVRWNPTFLSVDSVNPKKGFEKTISLLSDDALDLQVKEAKIVGGKTLDQPSELFELVRGGTKVVEGRDQTDFVVKLKPGVKPQKVSEQLVVLTNVSGRDTLRVPIRGDFVGRLSFNVQFGAIPLAEPGAETVRDLEVVAKEGTFKVVKAEVPDSPVKVEVIPGSDGTRTTIRLKYVGETAGTNGIRTLKVETDDPDQGVLEVPVRYQTASASKSAKAAPAATPTGTAAATGTKTGPKAGARD